MVGVRTLLAACGGGHLEELVAVRDRLPFDAGEVIWFTPDTEQSRSLLRGESVVAAHPAPPRDWRAALRNGSLAGALLRRLPVDVALSTGASTAVSTLPLAARSGATAVYLESAARVDGPSLSGRMLAAVPAVTTVCQSRAWAGGRWTYAGSVFDGYAPGPERRVDELSRVVVTVGSQAGYPFDRLLAHLVPLLPPGAEVLWQTGATDAAAHGVCGVATVPADELSAAMARADLVVAHAGVGSALTAVRAGVHPVLVPRTASAGEHVDDHQRQIAVELHERGLATFCEPERLRTDVLLAAARRTVVPRADTPPLALPPWGRPQSRSDAPSITDA